MGRRRGARAPRDQCHQPAQDVAGFFCRKGFRPLPLASAGSGATGIDPANQCLQRAPKKLLVALGSARSTSMIRSARGHGGDKAGVAETCGNAPRQVAAS